VVRWHRLRHRPARPLPLRDLAEERHPAESVYSRVSAVVTTSEALTTVLGGAGCGLLASMPVGVAERFAPQRKRHNRTDGSFGVQVLEHPLGEWGSVLWRRVWPGWLRARSAAPRRDGLQWPRRDGLQWQGGFARWSGLFGIQEVRHRDHWQSSSAASRSGQAMRR
jgi:hypothetical protein